MDSVVFIDGVFYPKGEAKVSVFDHGFLYGDGVFEGIRAYSGRIFRLHQHLDRLYASAKALMLDVPIAPEEMAKVVLESCRRNHLSDAYIRLVVSRGVGDLGLDPRKCAKATVVCIADAISLYPAELYARGMAVVTVPTRRSGTDQLNPRIKSLNYLNNILAKIEANSAGVPEAVMLNAEGHVVECTGDNIFVVQGGILLTPPPWVGILDGITRAVIMDIARDAGISVREEVLTRFDLWTADECFLTGTAAEAIPVVRCDERVIGSGQPGPVTVELIRRFRALVQAEGTPIG